MACEFDRILGCCVTIFHLLNVMFSITSVRVAEEKITRNRTLLGMGGGFVGIRDGENWSIRELALFNLLTL